MKIEKVNNNQIRCTLTKQDLKDRELKLSELAYGSEKAKSLFRDMMRQASYEFGFEAEDIPLMIEAIPVSDESIILTVTKVENPDELDTRFSKFSSEASAHRGTEATLSKRADEILDLFNKIKEEKLRLDQKQAASGQTTSDQKAISNNDKADRGASGNEEAPINMVKLFVFDNLDVFQKLSHVLNEFYGGRNSLYKREDNGRYYLVLNKDHHTPEEFNKICNVLSEYGVQLPYSPGSEEFFLEHHVTIVKDNAIAVLSTLS